MQILSTCSSLCKTNVLDPELHNCFTNMTGHPPRQHIVDCRLQICLSIPEPPNRCMQSDDFVGVLMLEFSIVVVLV